MSTKAVHMELVSSLTKDDCILGRQRFVARRGLPGKIYSDSGNNFLGARNDLIKIKALLDKTDTNHSIANYAMQKGCEWLTIPPCSAFWRNLGGSNQKHEKAHEKSHWFARLSY